MGWIFNTQVSHANTFINELLAENGAHTVAPATGFGDWIDVALKCEWAEPFSLFYMANSASAAPKGEDYIGVALIDFERECSVREKKAAPDGLLWLPDRDDPVPYSSKFVQVWGYKLMSSDMGVCYYNCPTEWFDRVPIRGEYEEHWRQEVLRRSA